ncbi:unnamed protein product, partial [Callosobruchus maculatus]
MLLSGSVVNFWVPVTTVLVTESLVHARRLQRCSKKLDDCGNTAGDPTRRNAQPCRISRHTR